MPTLTAEQSYSFIAEGRTEIALTVSAGSMASVSTRRADGTATQQKYYEDTTVTGIYPADAVVIAAESGAIGYAVTNKSAAYSLDPTTGAVVGLVGPDGATVVDTLTGRVSNGISVCDFSENGAIGATSGSAGATAALDSGTLHNGKPMLKYTMGAAGTFQAAFTFTAPITLAQLKTLQIPIRFTRNATDDGAATVFATATIWFNVSSGGRVQLPLVLSGNRPNGTFVLSMAPGAATQGWTFSSGPTDTNIWDTDTGTVSGINFVISVNAGREVGESIWLGEMTANARRQGIVCIDFDGPYSSVHRWMLPMLEAQGLRSRLNLNHLNVGASGYMTYGQIDRAYAAGHSCGSHLYTASIGNGYSGFANEDAIYADISAGYANLAARGYHRDNFTHVRGGSIVDHANTVPATKQAEIQAAHARAGTKAIRYGSIIGGPYTRLQSISASNVDPLNVQGAIQVTSTTTSADLTAIVDRARDRGEMAVLTFHRSVVSTPGSLEITNANFDVFAQYLGAEVRKGVVSNMTFGEALRSVGAISF